MSNHTMAEVVQNIRARSFLFIKSWEETRVLKTVTDVRNTYFNKHKIYIWDVADGLQDTSLIGVPLALSPEKILDYIASYEEPAFFVLLDYHSYFNEKKYANANVIIRKMRNILAVPTEENISKKVICISSDVVVPAELERECSVIEYPLPDIHELKLLFREVLEKYSQKDNVMLYLTTDDIERLVCAAVGLTMLEAEIAFNKLFQDGVAVNSSSISVILNEKKHLTGNNKILEFVEVDENSIDIGGMENLKNWFTKKKRLWSEDAKKHGVQPPKAAMIAGVPGCGKKLMAKNLSFYWQLPLYKININKYLMEDVSTYANLLDSFIKSLSLLSPAILWIDESTQYLPHKSEKLINAQNLIVLLIERILDSSIDSLFVLVTIDNTKYSVAKNLTKGVLDEIFFIDLPTYNERVNIFKIQLKELLTKENSWEYKADTDTLANFARLSEGLTGEEIRYCIKTAMLSAYYNKRDVTADDIITAINLSPSFLTQNHASVWQMRTWANMHAVNAASAEDLVGYNYSTGHENMNTPSINDAKTSRGGNIFNY